MTRAVVVLAMIISGCISTNTTFTTGRPFDMSKVSTIQNSKTTSAELLSTFGEPYVKTTISGTEQKWFYMYIQGNSSAKGGPFTGLSVATKGTNQTLEILLRDGVVQTFTTYDGPIDATYGNPPPVTP